MSRSGLGLQGELAAAAVMQSHDSSTAFVERLGGLTTPTTLLQALEKLDAISAVLFIATIVVFFVPIFILFPPIPVERSDALRQTHTRVGLSPKRSNLRDQFSATHSPQPGQPAKVQSLFIYPVKSCKGIEVARSRVFRTGLEYDRLYTFAQLRSPAPDPAAASGNDVIDVGPVWEFLTQRQLPLLANVCVDLWVPDATKTSRQLGKVEEAFLVVRFPWMDHGLSGLVQWLAAKISRGFQARPEKEFMLPVAFPSHQEIKARGYTFANVKVWKSVSYSLNAERELPQELSRYLGVKHRLGLFRMDPSNRRQISPGTNAEDILGYQPHIDFQDAYPLHLLSLTSLHNLETLILKDDNLRCLDARRFRPNIIISGSEEYDEENWKLINLKQASTKEECQFHVACRTLRCKLPNVDPNNGIRHKVEPDRTLRKFRNVDEGAPKTGCMGMQLCPMIPDAGEDDEPVSYIGVGMNVDVLQRGAHSYSE